MKKVILNKKRKKQWQVWRVTFYLNGTNEIRRHYVLATSKEKAKAEALKLLFSIEVSPVSE